MAHFAKISESNEVLTVNVVNDSDAPTETDGQVFLENVHGWPRNLWIQTSYNTLHNEHKLGGTPFRGNYAGLDFTWDPENQIFWPPQPYSSWVKNTTTAKWISPIGDEPELTEEQVSQNQALTHTWMYVWNEDNQTWDLTNTRA